MFMFKNKVASYPQWKSFENISAIQNVQSFLTGKKTKQDWGTSRKWHPHIMNTCKLHTFHTLITQSPVTWTPAHCITSEDLLWSRKHGSTCTVYLPHTSTSSEPRISERTSTRGAADNLWRTVQKFVFKPASESTKTTEISIKTRKVWLLFLQPDTRLCLREFLMEMRR